jgi:hypothetical protein
LQEVPSPTPIPHPLLVIYTIVVTVAAPELNGEKRRGEERRDVE